MLAPTYGSEWTRTVSTRSSVLDYYCAHVFMILWCILYFSFTLEPTTCAFCVPMCVCVYMCTGSRFGVHHTAGPDH